MFLEFLEWFSDFAENVLTSAFYIMRMLAYIIMAVLLSPIWILPFIFWFFVERRKSDGREDM